MCTVCYRILQAHVAVRLTTQFVEANRHTLSNKPRAAPVLHNVTVSPTQIILVSSGFIRASSAKDAAEDSMSLIPPLTADEKKAKPLRICVTGATGYLAGHIVQRLLAAGHVVHGTARQPNSSSSTKHLLAMPGAAERLKLFKADLLQPEAFDAAVAGCDVVIHTASPYLIKVPKGQEEALMIKPAVFGTENVLNSVNRTPSVKSVILTASTVSVWSDPYERGRDHVFTEDDWNTAATADTFPYFYSKTKAEQRAYAMQEEAGKRWRLCSMNPGAIWGPPTSDRPDGESVGHMIDLLSGALWPWAPPLGTAVVDVRDVAMAHCIAAITPSASGRYLLNSECDTIMTTAAKILRKVYPKRWLPPLKPPLRALLIFGPFLGLPVPITKATYRKRPKISTDKAARDLGITQYITVRQSVLDMAQDMLAKGMVPAFTMPKATGVIIFDLCVVVLFFWVVSKILGLLFAGVSDLMG